ncbi:acyl-CoA dehydrogenase family protein [Desulfothermus sp.]
MDFSYTKEQLLIQKSAREFAKKELLPKAMERDENGIYPKESLELMADLGFLGMLVSEEYGGMEVDTISYVLALSEIASACASTAVITSVHNSQVCELISKFGTKEQKQEYLNKLTTGEYMGSFAISEEGAGSDIYSISTTAKREGDYFVLNGKKRWIAGGANSHLFIVFAKTDENNISAFIVTRDMRGFLQGESADKMGLRACDITEIIFEDLKVPVKNLLGKENEGVKIAMLALDLGRIGIAAISYGVALAAFDTAVKYSKQRVQFNRTICKNQGLRWMISDMTVDLEAGKFLLFNAALKRDQGKNYSKDASIAKLYLSEMANRVVDKALQIHGGYGYIKEYPIERLYRDVRAFTILQGTSQIQRNLIANEIIGDKK